MSDDDKRNDKEQESTESQSQAREADPPEAAEKKLADVIPFNPTNEEVIEGVNKEVFEPVKDATQDAMESIKAAFDTFKKQLAPLRASLHELSTALKEGAKAAETKPQEAKKADEEPTKETVIPDDAAVSAAREAGEFVQLGINKVKAQVAKAKFDFSGTVKREFAHYADEHLSEDEYTVDEDGKRVVTVDGGFFAKHATEVIPALIRGTVGSFFQNLLGEDLIKVADEKKKEAEAAEGVADETPDADAKADDAEKSEDPSKYRVEFDFSRALGDAIRNAEVSPEAKTEKEIHDRTVGREILIEGARIVEDSLNGIATDTRERLEDAVKRADLDDADKAPEDIEAIDEKHRKILELSKQFEKNMNPDKPQD